MSHLKHIKKKMSWFNYKGIFVSNIYHANILLFICCLSILGASLYIYAIQHPRYSLASNIIPSDFPPTLRNINRTQNSGKNYNQNPESTTNTNSEINTNQNPAMQ